jgi:hypothetical protein
MILIAHRGNIDGPNPDKENHPDYLMSALEKGFDVEVDVWVQEGKVFFGHDAPQYDVTNLTFYQGPFWKYNSNMWVHCKNFEALEDSYHCWWHKFYHNEDDFTLTKSGFIWTYPRNLPIGRDSIAVMPERVPGWDISKAWGVCTDYVLKYSKP